MVDTSFKMPSATYVGAHIAQAFSTGYKNVTLKLINT